MTLARHVSACLILTAGLAAVPARAEEAAVEAESEPTASALPDLDFSFTGYYRISAEGFSDMRVDADGNAYNQNQLFTHRLSFAPSVKIGPSLSVTAELQLMSGFLSWDSPAARLRTASGMTRGVDVDGVIKEVPVTDENFGPPRSHDGGAFRGDVTDELRLRKLSLTWRLPIGQLRVGRMASQWGLGILANGGDDETQDWSSPRFGQDRDFGDIVDRILFVTAPFAALSDSDWARRWILALGGDVVVRDERTDRNLGDLALEGIGALRYAHDLKELGIYVAYQDTRDRNQDTLKVSAFDVYGKGTWRLGDFSVYGVGELAWVLGETTLARNNAFTDLLVQQLGWVARAGAEYRPFNVTADVEIGYASGDSNPNDEFLRNFTFDPDYNPSLILFDQLRAAESVASAANASDPQNVAYPPSAARLIPTSGSVTNAVYIKPTLRYRWNDLGARFAFMAAFAEEDNVDPYGSNANGGGGPVSYQGGLGTNRDLGYELDLGVDYTYRLRDWVEVNASLQGGYFIAGSAFADINGATIDPILIGYGRLLVRWLPPPRPAPSVQAPQRAPAADTEG